MPGEYGPLAQQMIIAMEGGEIQAERGYLVGLDRPALLAPDRAAAMADARQSEILASGHRWRVVMESLWHDLLALGRDRPLQQVYVVAIADIEAWLDTISGDLGDLEPDGWRGNQGTLFILPIL